MSNDKQKQKINNNAKIKAAIDAITYEESSVKNWYDTYIAEYKRLPPMSMVYHVIRKYKKEVQKSLK